MRTLQRPTERGFAWLVLALGLTVAALAAVRAFDGPERQVGVRQVQAAPPAPTGSATPRAAQVTEAPIPPTPRPVLVEVPRLRLRATVLPVGVTADGAMRIPRDARRVGWYRFGPAPGAPEGSAVLAGHVDSRAQGRGVFFRLATIEVGDTVRVTQAGGEVLAYRVVARESIRKQRLPADELFARDGSPRLTLITCSGPYVAEQGGYQDNLVVTATPVRLAPMADQS